MSTDMFGWRPRIAVVKYSPDTVQDIIRTIGHEPSGDELRHLEATAGLSADSIVEVEGNELTDAGRNRIRDLIIGSGAAFTGAQGIIGVGSGTTAFAGSQTALAGNGAASTAWYQKIDAGFPTSTGTGKFTAAATFATGDGNFAGGWQEWCFAIATGTITAGGALASVGTSPVMLNRKVTNLGTKASGAVWTLTAEVTLNAS